jgi:DNA-binding LacI/PurR family transcriptional regulator
MTTPPRTTPTLQDIAEQADCSKNTVSLALRDSPRISETTRRTVQRIARRLGYVPNIAARTLSRRRSGMIGVYTRALHDAVRTELVNSLINRLHTAEYRPVLGLGLGHAGPWRTAPWVRTFGELNVEAVVVLCESEARGPAWARDIPKILLASDPNPRLRCDYVALDRHRAGQLAAEHLLETGRSRLLVACPSSMAFCAGAVETIQRAGQRADVLEIATVPELRDRLLPRCRNPRNRPGGAIFGDAPLAAEFLHLARQNGLHIPRDLAVVAYDYLPWAHLLEVPLTTIEQPITDLAQQAVDCVRFRLEHPQAPFRREVLDHMLNVRVSSGPH